MTAAELLDEYEKGNFTKMEFFNLLKENGLGAPEDLAEEYTKWCERIPPGSPLIYICSVNERAKP